MTRNIIISFCLTIACTATLKAQTFISHLTNKTEGQGTVTLLHDARLDAIVNGEKQYVAPVKEKEEILPGVPVGSRIKAQGYRIQIFWGGSSKTDERNARRAGETLNRVCPEYQSYPFYKAPNWVCNIGDFATRKEGEEAAKKLKKAKLISNESSVVRSEVYIYKQEY